MVALLAAVGFIVPGLGDDAGDGGAGGPEAAVSQLDGGPSDSEERDAITAVLAAIESGEDLSYDEDGGTFENREGLLPTQPAGYYREYTVETPGSPDRGARRLVIGDGGETYYTDDHYSSFAQIDPGEFVG